MKRRSLLKFGFRSLFVGFAAVALFLAGFRMGVMRESTRQERSLELINLVNETVPQGWILNGGSDELSITCPTDCFAAEVEIDNADNWNALSAENPFADMSTVHHADDASDAESLR